MTDSLSTVNQHTTDHFVNLGRLHNTQTHTQT